MQNQKLRDSSLNAQQSPSLLSLPANCDIVTYLYDKNYLSQDGLFFGWRVLNQKFNLGFILAQICYWLSAILILFGCTSLLILKWHTLPDFYQHISYPLLITSTILGAWMYDFRTLKAKLFLVLGALVALIGFYEFFIQGILI